jgi:hypothetical protein
MYKMENRKIRNIFSEISKVSNNINKHYAIHKHYGHYGLQSRLIMLTCSLKILHLGTSFVKVLSMCQVCLGNLFLELFVNVKRSNIYTLGDPNQIGSAKE